MPGAVIYCRVSTKEQVSNLSLATQEKHCREYCERNGFLVDRLFVEEGESAKTTKRPEFQKLLLHCRQNQKRIDYVVVYSLSRFSRHTLDHAQIKTLLLSLGVSLRSVTEPIDDTSSGKFMETMFSAVAQLDNDIRSERTIAGMKAAAERGRWPFPAPLGYRFVSTVTRSRMELDPQRSVLVRAAFEMFATGNYERNQVLRKVTAQGLRTHRGKKVSQQTFSRMLTNPIYVGRVNIPKWGADYQGEFEPIVNLETFQRVQYVLSGRKTTFSPYRSEHPDFPLRHFVRCSECQRPLTASWSKGRSKRYAYYRCANSGCKSINVQKSRIEQSFIELLRSLQPRSEYLRLFEAVVLDVWKGREAQATQEARSLRAKVSAVLERKERLTAVYVYEQGIDKETYQQQLSKLREEQLLAEMELNEARVEEIDIEGLIGFATNVISDASRFWVEGSLEQKQRFQRVLFPEGLSFDGEKFGTAPTCLAFSYLREVSQRNASLASRTGVEPVSPP